MSEIIWEAYKEWKVVPVVPVPTIAQVNLVNVFTHDGRVGGAVERCDAGDGLDISEHWRMAMYELMRVIVVASVAGVLMSCRQ